MTNELKEQINVVVEARELEAEATNRRMESYGVWLKEHDQLFTNEKDAKLFCLEAEAILREMTLSAYTETGNKAPEIGVGIRKVTKLEYDPPLAMAWAIEHKIALSLDRKNFEVFAKSQQLAFVTITEEPMATIATELKKV